MEHLRYVVPADQYDRVLECISRDVSNHFSPNDGIRHGGKSHTYDEEMGVYHLLVLEETGNKQKQFRFVTIDESMLEDDAFPDLEDVVVEYKGLVHMARDHFYGDRWHVNKALIRGVRLDIDGLYSLFKVQEKTGRTLDVSQNPLVTREDLPVFAR